jgi:hypothetical protein
MDCQFEYNDWILPCAQNDIECNSSSSKATFFSATCLQKVAFGYVFFREESDSDEITTIVVIAE